MTTTTSPDAVVDDARALDHAAAARLPTLDGVRGAAIATVLVFHGWAYWPAASRSALDRVVSALSGQCWVGVDLFFVLSGFLITRILLRARGKAGYYAKFYARRALRIFPLYYALIFLLCVVGGLALSEQQQFRTLWQSQEWLWLYAYNLEIFRVGHWFSDLDNCWSLAVEEQFYLVWPMVVAALAPRRLAVVALLAAAACIALRALMPHLGYSATQIYVITPARCDGLMLGGVIAILEAERVPAATIRRLAIGAIVLGVVVLVAGALHFLGKLTLGGWMSTACTPIFAGMIAWSTLSPDDAPMNRALLWRPLAWLGKYSYGVYLIHEPVFLIVQNPLMHVVVPFSGAATSAVRLAIVAPVVVGLAVASFHWLETPFLRMKGRFA